METHVVPYASGLRTFVHGCSVPCMFLHGHVCSILGCGDFGGLVCYVDDLATKQAWLRSGSFHGRRKRDPSMLGTRIRTSEICRRL